MQHSQGREMGTGHGGGAGTAAPCSAQVRVGSPSFFFNGVDSLPSFAAAKGFCCLPALCKESVTRILFPKLGSALPSLLRSPRADVFSPRTRSCAGARPWQTHCLRWPCAACAGIKLPFSPPFFPYFPFLKYFFSFLQAALPSHHTMGAVFPHREPCVVFFVCLFSGEQEICICLRRGMGVE